MLGFERSNVLHKWVLQPVYMYYLSLVSSGAHCWAPCSMSNHTTASFTKKKRGKQVIVPQSHGLVATATRLLMIQPHLINQRSQWHHWHWWTRVARTHACIIVVQVAPWLYKLHRVHAPPIV